MRIVDCTDRPDSFRRRPGLSRGRQRWSLGILLATVNELQGLERVVAKIGEQRAMVEDLYAELADLVSQCFS